MFLGTPDLKDLRDKTWSTQQFSGKLKAMIPMPAIWTHSPVFTRSYQVSSDILVASSWNPLVPSVACRVWWLRKNGINRLSSQHIPTGISWKGRIESYQFSGLKICCSLRIEPAKWWTLSGIDERSLLQNMLEPCKRTTCKRMNTEQLSASSNQPSKLCFADPGSKTSLTQHVVFFVISLVSPVPGITSHAFATAELQSWVCPANPGVRIWTWQGTQRWPSLAETMNSQK